MEMIRNLTRRKLRTGLTVTGITIGIWALVVFSAMANKVDALVGGGRDYYAGKIVVTVGGFGGLGGQPLPLAALDNVRSIDGVDVVAPASTLLAAQMGAVSFGPPDQVFAAPAGADGGRETFNPELVAGRRLTADDEGHDVAVLGSSIAEKRHAGVGDSITIHDHTFQVVGVLEPTLTAPDVTIYVPFANGQQLAYEDLPQVLRDKVRAEDLASAFIVYPGPGADDQAIADEIEARLPDTTAMTGASYNAQVGSSVSIFNSIIVGIGLVSLIVGGLSVINTMAMSVAERTREIGIKRAIGASQPRIIRELMVEAGLIGAIGGILGVALGTLVVVLVNELTKASGTVLFQMTLGTAAFAFVFSTVLGVIAGIVPAWSAARLDTVSAHPNE
jgi:putative ABC transport system permease protein